MKKLALALLTAGLLTVGAALYKRSMSDEAFYDQRSAGSANTPAPTTTVAASVTDAPIPAPADWVDYGPVLEAGPEGTWDFLWGGLTPVGVVKKDGVYYFYYVAGDGYRSHDGGERHRAIGVATSRDGIHFIKHSDPVMTHSPFNGEEEGANSAGVTLDAQGGFVMVYGAAAGPGSEIVADGRLALASDGFHFTDVALVLDHSDQSLYGYGDEIFPVAAFQHNETWYVYYETNGGTAPRTLGITWGPQLDDLRYSARALDGSSGGIPVGAWGNVIRLWPDTIALFIQRLWWPNTFIEVRTASPGAPHQLSAPVERYDIPDLKRGTVFLDSQQRTWFMYYNDFSRLWRIKLAPAGATDVTPPTPPVNLAAMVASHDQVKLAWEAATDPDTGVVQYNIYRDGIQVGSTKGWTFRDTGLSELSVYTYHVAAVNFHGTEGPRARARATTPPDTTPPALTSVTSGGAPDQVEVVFNEPMDAASATAEANYSISDGITVIDASLGTDLKTVTLTTSGHIENAAYRLTVNDVLDRAAQPNPIRPNTQWIYTYSSIAGLVGYWNLDEGMGAVASDVSGYANNGIVGGATWQEGFINGALHFDGQDDYVLVGPSPSLSQVTNGSFTFAAWAKPDDVPSSSNGYGIVLRVGGHPAYFFGLSYGSDQRFHAQVITASEAFVSLRSGQIGPGGWRHVAMVVDDAARQLHLYLDGAPVSGSPVSYSDALMDLNEDVGENYSAGEYYVGSSKPDRGAGSFFARHFKGLIDDVRIYDRALSPAEGRGLFNSFRTASP